MRRIRKFLALAPGDRRLLARAALALVVAGAALRVLPLGRLARRWPGQAPPPAEAAGAADGERVERIGWAVRTAAGALPWRPACLAQALAAKRLLAREGVAARLYFGVERGADSRLAAHAWVVAGEVDVVGGETRGRYTVVGSFG